jgi:hypothetical protein
MKKLRRFHEELRMMILVKVLKILSEYFYPAEIFATLPITRIASDRSFPTLRRIKTYLRKTTGHDGLNGRAQQNSHRETEVSRTQVLEEL